MNNANTLTPNIVRGGIAQPLSQGKNMYYMRGRKHSQGGIDIGENPRTGLEVEDGEVVQITPRNFKVFSSLKMGDKGSPANRVMQGENPNKVFNDQENFKKRNKLNDDGTKKAMYGTRKKVAAGILTSTRRNSLTDLSSIFDMAMLGDSSSPIKQSDAAQQAIQSAVQQSQLQAPQQASPMQQLAQVQTQSRIADLEKFSQLASQELAYQNNLAQQYANERERQNAAAQSANEALSQSNTNMPQGQSGTSSDGGTDSAGISSFLDNNWDKVSEMYNNLIYVGATPSQAAGICGNIYAESRFDPNAIGDNGKGLGYFQMHPEERQSYANYCKKNNLEQNDKSLASYVYNSTITRNVSNLYGDITNEDFISSEDPRKTASGFMAIYERPNPELAHLDVRQEAASQIYNRMINPQQNSNDMAVMKLGGKKGKHGGLNRKDDYGSSKKPYPSVKSGDFAGGGRSYPIPTRADAIDALRLAGLHGRSDVKAKVYRKYPDLKKAMGGRKKFNDAGQTKTNNNITTSLDTNTLLTRPEASETSDLLYQAMLTPSITIDPSTVQLENLPEDYQRRNDQAIADRNQQYMNNQMIDSLDIDSGYRLGDYIGLGSNVLGAGISTLLNRNALNQMKTPPRPLPYSPAKFKTKYNINPQLDEIRETEGKYERLVNNNSASSQDVRNTINQQRLNALTERAKLYADKENKETDLINKDIENRQSVRKDNVEKYNEWRKDKTTAENTIRDLKAENAVGFVNSLNQAVQGFLSTRDKRVSDLNNIWLTLQAYPHVSENFLASALNHQSAWSNNSNNNSNNSKKKTKVTN